MTWEEAKRTNPEAVRLAEEGRIREAVYTYAHGGCFSYSMRERRKRKKAQLNAGLAGRNRNVARRAVDARIFYTAWRRFLSVGSPLV